MCTKVLFIPWCLKGTWRQAINNPLIDCFCRCSVLHPASVRGELKKTRTFPVCRIYFHQPPETVQARPLNISCTSGWTNDFTWCNTFLKGAINCDYACKEKCCSPTLARWGILFCVIKTSTFNGFVET